MRLSSCLITMLLLSLIVGTAPSASAELRIRDICRVKGQEENTLHGLGLVVGLKGTGDSGSRPTVLALARTMQLMGMPVNQGPLSQLVASDFRDANNVAMVFVSATVPAAGARQGENLDCVVSAVTAKSIEGGTLMLTPLVGPRPGSNRVYAMASGKIELEDLNTPTSGKIRSGCRLEENFRNEFSQDGKITLVLNENHANFETTQEIAEIINNYPDFRSFDTTVPVAEALDQVNVEVTIPKKYLDSPVLFIYQVLNQRILNPEADARVVINEREGVIVIGSSVEIAPVAVAHNNLSIEAGAGAPSRFVAIAPEAEPKLTKLKSLVDALNALKVPTSDIIDIIKGLEKGGHIYGQVISH